MKKFLTLLFSFCLLLGCDNEDIVTKIFFDTELMTVQNATYITLNVNHIPADLSAPKYLWETSNSSIVDVTQQGNIAAISLGEAVVTVSSDAGLTASCKITVEAREATAIDLSEYRLVLDVGTTYTLSYEITPINTTYRTVTWISTNEDVATVNKGKISALSKGYAIIKVEMNNGVSDECPVTVNNVDVEGISLSASELIIEENEESQLYAAITPSNVTNSDLVWVSSNTSVATVDDNGCVVGVQVGTAYITATTVDGGYSASCEVTVTEIKVKGISLNKTSLSLFISQIYELEATVIPSNAANKNVVWTSSNQAVASVDNLGVVTAISNGTAMIYAESEDSNYVEQCLVSVKPFEDLVTIGAIMGYYTVSSSGIFYQVYAHVNNDLCESVILNQVLLMYQDGTIIDRTDYIGTIIQSGQTSSNTEFCKLSTSYDITQMKVGCFYEYKGTAYFKECDYSDWENYW